MLVTVGLEAPADFPEAAYNAVHARMQPHQPENPPAWHEYGGGWNAVAYRFLQCAEHDERLRASVAQYGPSPEPQERFEQERQLFGFFIAGLSTIESVCYAAYAIGHFLAPARFPIATPENLRAINPHLTRDKCAAEWPGDDLSLRLNDLVTSADFKEWSEIRNVLAHRTSPGRRFEHGPAVVVASAASHLVGAPVVGAVWLQGLAINEDLTRTRREWLAGQLAALFGAAEAFVVARL